MQTLTKLTEEEEIKCSAAIALLELRIEKGDIHESMDSYDPSLKYRTVFEYDVQGIALHVKGRTTLFKWEVSTFISQLLSFYGHKYTAQKLNERLETVCLILGISKRDFYGGVVSQSPKGVCLACNFLTLLGMCVYHEIVNSSTRGNTRVELLQEIGRRSFEILVKELGV